MSFSGCPDMGSSHTPDELLYQFPKIDKIRLVKYAKRFYANKGLEALRKVAEDLNLEVIDGTTLHWRRKAKAVAKYRWGLKCYYLYPKEGDRLGEGETDTATTQ